jgi:hypothetical protein
MSDTVGKQRIRTDVSTDVTVRLADSVGTNLAAVDASGRIAVSIAAQTLTAVAVSATTSANAAGNPIFIAPVVGGSALTATSNALDVNIKSSGVTAFPVSATTALNTAANPLLVQPGLGGAALSVSNPIPVEITNGTSFNSQANPTFAAVSKNTTINSVSNPILMQLSDGSAAVGTSGNPIYVTQTAGPEVPTGTVLHKYDKTASVASGGTANFDYTVTSGKTLSIQRMTFSAPEAGHFDVIVDPSGTPVNIGTVYVGPSCTTQDMEFNDIPLQVTTGLVLRVVKNNDSHTSAPYVVMWQGSEN